MNQEVYHIPALLEDSIKALDIKPDGIYVDATFGGGGHSRAIIDSLGPKGRLLAFDQDEDAIKNAIDDPRFTFVYGNFRYLTNFLRFYNVDSVDGILADLGVSFHHFDDSSRGFSFRADADLDMRMNRHSSFSVINVINEYSEEKLAEILYLYGEIAKSRQMARAIIKAREGSKITRTEQFLGIIEPFIDKRREKKDLACVFQALRIEVNGELEALRLFLQSAVTALKPGARLAVITYHSLEDRLVKNFIRSGNFDGKVTTDIYGRTNTLLRAVNSKPITAGETEIESNPRSRSAKLRVAEKI